VHGTNIDANDKQKSKQPNKPFLGFHSRLRLRVRVRGSA
jgi:hypothetical protein